MKALTHFAVPLLASFLFASAARAQLSAELAGCQELQDNPSRALVASCGTHVGCNMVLKLQKSCANAKEFLSKLQSALASRPEITNNDVFEANLPSLASSAILRRYVAEFQQFVRRIANDTSKGKVEFSKYGTRTYYEGGLKDGKPHGVGVSISNNGGMYRGQFEGGEVSGQAQVLQFEGEAQVLANRRTMYIGSFVAGDMSGLHLAWRPDGSVSIGAYEAYKKVGEWEYERPTGYHYRVLYGADGKVLATGPDAPPGQIAQLPSDPALDDPKVLGGAYRPN